MILFNRLKVIFVVCILLLNSGCFGGDAAIFHIREDVDFSFIKKVAVLPLDNLTNNKFADEIVRHLVISELLASGLVDVTIPGEVISAIKRLNITSITALDVKQIKDLGKIIKVEAIIMGSIEQYGEVKFGNHSAPEVTITLIMADVSTGSILWSVTQTRGGSSFMARHFGAKTETMSETALATVREALRTFTEY